MVHADSEMYVNAFFFASSMFMLLVSSKFSIIIIVVVVIFIDKDKAKQSFFQNAHA